MVQLFIMLSIISKASACYQVNLNAFSKPTMTFQQMDINQLGGES